jgi:hypothetical protein
MKIEIRVDSYDESAFGRGRMLHHASLYVDDKTVGLFGRDHHSRGDAELEAKAMRITMGVAKSYQVKWRTANGVTGQFTICGFSDVVSASAEANRVVPVGVVSVHVEEL